MCDLLTGRGCLRAQVLHVLAATVAGIGAATLAAPADVLQTRVQSGGSGTTLIGSASSILRSDGLAGFGRGWKVNVARLVPTFVVGSSIYEQVRKQLGIGFLE